MISLSQALSISFIPSSCSVESSQFSSTRMMIVETMSEYCTNILDHLVYITPPCSLTTTTDAFKHIGFTVVPGGEHSGGLTSNTLIIFHDGTYIELIAFTTPNPDPTTHPWASSPPGWLTYAFLGASTPNPSLSALINARSKKANSHITYLPESRLSRVRPDGHTLHFLLSIPHPQHGLHTLPFFCGDITPRQWRAPKSKIDHPCAATSIAHLRILSQPSKIDLLVRQFTTIIGYPPHTSSPTQHIWSLDTPNDDNDNDNDTDAQTQPRLILSLPRDDTERESADSHSGGIYEIALWADNLDEQVSLHIPYGQLLLIPRL